MDTLVDMSRLADTNQPAPPVPVGWERDRAIVVFEDQLSGVCGHLHGLHARLVESGTVVG